jgi:hypothetical protein
VVGVGGGEGDQEGLGHRDHAQKLHPRGPVGARGGDHGTTETDAGRFGQAPGSVGDLTDLAAEAHLPEGHHVGGQPGVHHGRRQGEDEGEVGGGLGDADAADGGGEDVGVTEHQPGVLFEHGHEQGQATAVDPLGRPARRRRR